MSGQGAQPPAVAAASSSPDSDISPKTKVPGAVGGSAAIAGTTSFSSTDYFSVEKKAAGAGGTNGAARSSGGHPMLPPLKPGAAAHDDDDVDPLDTSGVAINVVASPDSSSTSLGSPLSDETDGPRSRKASVNSLTWSLPQTTLPQGNPRKSDAGRIRQRSPPPDGKFVHHVAFDNISLDTTKTNSTSLTLNAKHKGYKHNRTSRTFMIGVDEHAYSDYALEWLLEELVDDGDEVVCVRVIEKEIRPNDKSYRSEAQQLLQSIQDRSKLKGDPSISIIVEYACGKLHNTFQHFIQIYQPSMLVVGTKGRPLDGVQGLFSTRNSFSKYCLQYSPIPVVVVRPTEKRNKKKSKRANDPSRHSYAQMLAFNDGKHEADSEASSVYELETRLSPEEEAHRVAAAIGLPAQFDPTIKPIDLPSFMQQRQSAASAASSMLSPQVLAASAEASSLGNIQSPVVVGPGGKILSTKGVGGPAGESEPDEDDSEDETGPDGDGDFEVMTGSQVGLETQKKERLHRMEMGEAKALLGKAARKYSVESSASAVAGGGGASGARMGTADEEPEGEGGEDEDADEEDEDGNGSDDKSPGPGDGPGGALLK